MQLPVHHPNACTSTVARRVVCAARRTMQLRSEQLADGGADVVHTVHALELVVEQIKGAAAFAVWATPAPDVAHITTPRRVDPAHRRDLGTVELSLVSVWGG